MRKLLQTFLSRRACTSGRACSRRWRIAFAGKRNVLGRRLLALAVRALALVLGLSLPCAALAEGPGSRIGTTPDVPAPPPTSTQEVKRCESFSGERKERCLREMRAAAGLRSSGPEATGMGSGAGAGAASGTTGGASFGGSAPR